LNTLEIARKFAALGEMNEACQAYKLALNECKDKEPAVEFECALYILQFGCGEDYKISYTCLRDLYNQGFAQDDILAIMDEAFYQPNIKRLQKRYEKNCKLLSKYPYIFRKDFLAFAELPIIFFPYDDNQYTPYFLQKQKFGDYVNFRHEVISRNFFRDLEKPILAADVFSQYELEYLNDNVRKSEWVARENHIYLHYTSWPVFCAYLQVLDLQALLKDKKIVFLIEDEIEQYPIDFKERFGIDYSQYEVKSIGIREINKLIWHTQLSSHNGGDFFNEIFDDHPNLLVMPTIIFDNIMAIIDGYKKGLKCAKTIQQVNQLFDWNNSLPVELFNLGNPTDKDILVAIYLNECKLTSPHIDNDARIVPAIFFQPHFYGIFYKIKFAGNGLTQLYSDQYEQIVSSSVFNNFKYVKTFTPMRRITNSYASTIKFQLNNNTFKGEFNEKASLDNAIINRILNRSFMIDWQNRFFKDSVLVRFEDGKLNPKATFTALAAFLDLPYTESMTYCSLSGERNPESLEGNDIGFSVAAIYRTNDEFANNSERAFIEFFMRDAYEYYGYDFKYYDGSEIDEERLLEWLNNFTVIDGFMRNTRKKLFESAAADSLKNEVNSTETSEQLATLLMEKYMNKVYENRYNIAKILMRGLNFVNKKGQPLHMMPLLKLDPELLEQPLYR
jgi:hypothetical protein